MSTIPVHHPLADGHAPDWADEWGQDRLGPFAAFEVDGAVQRLRWLPPGWFRMGSPVKEPGRWQDEGPQHRVRIAIGFWLFETPCTQALWQAVMGENPSRFADPERPVERVSWEDVLAFIDRLNNRLPALALGLPSEAQWEYACRAGSETALYSGPIEIPGERDAPALDNIAWYGGNSGVDYDLDEAEDSASWPEKQYATERAGTRKVKGRQPNRWGLYDMLGNVWEWTRDRWHDDYRDAPEDGTAWETGDGEDRRVVRGGSWLVFARLCRCAARFRYLPVERDDVLGFRCARAQW